MLSSVTMPNLNEVETPHTISIAPLIDRAVVTKTPPKSPVCPQMIYNFININDTILIW